MTKILIVEDDAAQARVLARAIAVRRPDYTVLTTPNGLHATRLMREQDVDLVLTDLQMPEMNGFELLAWMLEHRPGVAVFTMTAYGSDQTFSQLSSHGGVECFTKPIDIEAVVQRMADSLSRGVRGHVRNLNLAPFLQLLEIERMTCTLHVEQGAERGALFVREGELVNARLGQEEGERAAISILQWSRPSITISGACVLQERTIEKPLSFVILEALRLHDESARESSARKLAVPSLLEDAHGGLPLPSNTLAVAVVDLESGAVLARAHREGVPVAELVAMAAAILRHGAHTARRLSDTESVEELVLNGPSRCELIRPLPELPAAFVLLVFDPNETNLVMARIELQRLVDARFRRSA